MGDAQWTAEEAILNFDMTALYANWVRTMNDLQDTGCTRAEGVSTLPMSSGANSNSYCCLPTPKGSNPLYPKISYCSPQYNQTDTLGSMYVHKQSFLDQLSAGTPERFASILTDCGVITYSPDVVPNNWGNGGSRGWPGAPTWSVAYVIIPGHVLQYTADTELINTHCKQQPATAACGITGAFFSDIALGITIRRRHQGPR